MLEVMVALKPSLEISRVVSIEDSWFESGGVATLPPVVLELHPGRVRAVKIEYLKDGAVPLF